MKPASNSLASSKKKKARKLLEKNRYSEALPLLESACRASPGDGEAWLMLGAVHGQLGNAQAAIHASGRAASLMPASIQALDNLALGYHQTGEISKACSVLEQRLALEPQHRETVLRLAQGLLSTGQTDKAIDLYRQYLEKRPADHEFHLNLGIACEYAGNLSCAENHYQKTLELRPGFSGALQNLANVLSAQGRIDEAIDTYREALRIDPGNAFARSNYLLNLHYSTAHTAQDIYREHTELMHDACAAENTKVFDNKPDAERPLRVGFVSPDMRTHSVACFLEALLESMDREAFTCYCYADVPQPDATTARLRKLSLHWCDIANTDINGICNRIRGDRIDILIDLAGHTSCRNMSVFATRPAPVQITWLGYPDTTGLRCMDYRLTDSYADPVGEGTPGTEELLRLEGSFLCYKPLPGAPDITELPAKNNGYVTFGSFNNLAKVNDQVLDLWARLLRRVTNSRLYIKNPSFTDDVTRENYRRRIVDMGIAAGRITLAGRTPSPGEHLQLYSKIDIGLDTFPYNGTTTTCEAMWMGVPVVTRAGLAHAGRVGVSLLNAANHPEWIGRDDESFLHIAAELAGDTDSLSEIRGRLRDDMRHSLLCDSGQFARCFTRALRNAWIEYCNSSSR